MAATIRVVVADDHPMLIEGMRNVLSAQPSIAVVGVANSFEQVPEVLTATSPHVLVLDLLGMGDAILALMQRLQRQFPQVGVVIFSTALNYAADLIDLGVRGYVTKTEMVDNLVKAVTAIAQGGMYFSPLVQRHLELISGDSTLTSRELLALRLFVEGMETAEIATEMNIKPHSVQNLFNSMYEKTQCRGRRQLTEWYKRKYGSGKE
jgi:DNA-binding NarL/FixJ family response regulator